MAKACSVARCAEALPNRRVGDDPVPGRAAVFADLAPAVIVSVGTDVEDYSNLHDFTESFLDAFCSSIWSGEAWFLVASPCNTFLRSR